MKTCGWTFHRITCAILLLLWCYVEVADERQLSELDGQSEEAERANEEESGRGNDEGGARHPHNHTLTDKGNLSLDVPSIEEVVAKVSVGGPATSYETIAVISSSGVGGGQLESDDVQPSNATHSAAAVEGEVGGTSEGGDGGGGAVEEVAGGTVVVAPSEEMPSFNEWAKKRLEEQEKNGHHGASGSSPTTKAAVKQKQQRHKNYASTDCGAKVLSANPEAQAVSAVLGHYTDDYMLNPCEAKIWLVIELCESIQVDRIEIANFELFSSSPKEFSAFSSDRFPTREWKHLGSFVAKDERVLQNFSMDHSTFGKFFKLEVESHYGSEHFCPLSRLRVYGTSEYEALDSEEPSEETQVAGDKGVTAAAAATEEDELVDGLHSSQESPNLFGSAKDAVINMVKTAARVLRNDKKGLNVEEVNKGDKSTDGGAREMADTRATNNCICVERLRGECEETLDDEVSQLMQCEYHGLRDLLLTVWSGHFPRVCSGECLSTLGRPTVEGVSSPSHRSACGFFRCALGERRFGALCALARRAVVEERGGRRGEGKGSETCPYSNVSTSPLLTPSLEALGGGTNKKGTNVVADPMQHSSHNTHRNASPIHTPVDEMSVGHTEESSSTVSSSSSAATATTSIKEDKIEPTKTMSSDSVADVSSEDQAVKEDGVEVSLAELSSEDDVSSFRSFLYPRIQPSEMMSSMEEAAATVSVSHSTDAVSTSEGFEQGDCSVFPFATESPAVDALDRVQEEPAQATVSTQEEASGGGGNISAPSAANGAKTGAKQEESGFLPPSMSVAQKESVFVRLTNRIKALELNMSLSSQYLEELSRRYKKQMEEMQKSFNKTILALNETAKMAHERDLKQQEMISELRSQLNNLSSIVSMLAADEGLNGRHVTFIVIEAALLLGLLLVCVRQSRMRVGEGGQVDVKQSTPLKTNVRSSSLGNLGSVGIKELDQKSVSGELILSRGWENVSVNSSCSSVHTDKSWQEVENPKKRKKRNRNNNNNLEVRPLYRSLSNNVLVGATTKPPIPPAKHNSSSFPVKTKIKAEMNSSAAGLLFNCSKRRSSRPTNGVIDQQRTNQQEVEEERRVNAAPPYLVVNHNRFAGLPHYERPLVDSMCRARQKIIEGAPTFNMKEAYNVVWG